jgi:Arm DNA-binding domain
MCATIRFELWDLMWDQWMVRLTERGVQTAKPGRHIDGDGLHLVVSETGRKKWVLRYQIAGVRKDKGLGSYPAVGLNSPLTKSRFFSFALRLRRRWRSRRVRRRGRRSG